MVVALGDYGCDWTLGKNGKAINGETEVLRRDPGPATREAQVSLDDDALNPTFGYINDDGSNHVVWFLDAATLFNEIKIGDDHSPARLCAVAGMGRSNPSGRGGTSANLPGSNKPTGLEAPSPYAHRPISTARARC